MGFGSQMEFSNWNHPSAYLKGGVVAEFRCSNENSQHIKMVQVTGIRSEGRTALQVFLASLVIAIVITLVFYGIQAIFNWNTFWTAVVAVAAFTLLFALIFSQLRL